MNKLELEDHLITNCADGNLRQVQDIMPFFKNQYASGFIFTSAINAAARYGHTPIIEYIFNNPPLQHYNNSETKFLNQYGIEALSIAARNNHIDIIRYFLFPKNDNHPHLNLPEENLSKLWIYACEFGHSDIIQYLLTSPSLEHHVDIDFMGGIGLDKAIEHQHMDIVHYLLTSPQLKKHAVIAFPENLFLKIIKEDNQSALQYFIFDYSIALTKKIENVIIDFPHVQKMFASRDLSQKLQQDLNSTSYHSSNKLKV